MMKKKSSASSVLGKRVGRSVRNIPDSQIDFSDMPKLSNEQLKRMHRHGQAADCYPFVAWSLVSHALSDLKLESDPKTH